MPPELRKRKAPSAPLPAPAPKKKVSVARAAAKVKEAPAPKANGSAAAAAKPAKVAAGDVISLVGFGGEIETQDGAKTTLQKLVEGSEKGVVLFTYPRASTPGCMCIFLSLALLSPPHNPPNVP
jgi:peroxiredoxin Q/BCP